MDCLADTVTVIRHFSEAGKIGRRAYELISGVERGEHHCYVSTISLVEIPYLSEKNRIRIRLGEALEKLNKSENYSIVDLTPEIVNGDGAKKTDWHTYLRPKNYNFYNWLSCE